MELKSSKYLRMFFWIILKLNLKVLIHLFLSVSCFHLLSHYYYKQVVNSSGKISQVKLWQHALGSGFPIICLLHLKRVLYWQKTALWEEKGSLFLHDLTGKSSPTQDMVQSYNSAFHCAVGWWVQSKRTFMTLEKKEKNIFCGCLSTNSWSRGSTKTVYPPVDPNLAVTSSIAKVTGYAS